MTSRMINYKHDVKNDLKDHFNTHWTNDSTNGSKHDFTHGLKKQFPNDFQQIVEPKFENHLTCFPWAHSTDVVLRSLCLPNRWSDAGVGIGMLHSHTATQLRSRQGMHKGRAAGGCPLLVEPIASFVTMWLSRSVARQPRESQSPQGKAKPKTRIWEIERNLFFFEQKELLKQSSSKKPAQKFERLHVAFVFLQHEVLPKQCSSKKPAQKIERLNVAFVFLQHEINCQPLKQNTMNAVLQVQPVSYIGCCCWCCCWGGGGR